MLSSFSRISSSPFPSFSFLRDFKVTVDGKKYETEAVPIQRFFQKNGIQHYCFCDWYPNMKICEVKADGQIINIHTTLTKPNMVIETLPKELHQQKLQNLGMILKAVKKESRSHPYLPELQILQSKIRTIEDVLNNVRDKRLYFDNSSATIRYDPNLCTKCGKCVDKCPVDVLFMTEHGVETIHNKPISLTQCIQCGNCVRICPSGAFKFQNHSKLFKAMLSNPHKKKIALVGPELLIYLELKLNLPDNTITYPKLSNALKKCGFDYVKSTEVCSDICALENAKLLLNSKGARPYPKHTGMHLTECAIFNAIYGRLDKHVSTIPSPFVIGHIIFGNSEPSEIFSFSPCHSAILSLAGYINESTNMGFNFNASLLLDLLKQKDIDFTIIDDDPNPDETLSYRSRNSTVANIFDLYTGNILSIAKKMGHLKGEIVQEMAEDHSMGYRIKDSTVPPLYYKRVCNTMCIAGDLKDANQRATVIKKAINLKMQANGPVLPATNPLFSKYYKLYETAAFKLGKKNQIVEHIKSVNTTSSICALTMLGFLAAFFIKKVKLF